MMKKAILYSVAILSVFLTVSCSTDDYNENEIRLENKEMDENGDDITSPPKKKN
jgi:hypothetical protein